MRHPLAIVCSLIASVAVQAGCYAAPTERPPHVPEAYKPVYTQSFDTPESIKDFVFTDPGAWRHAKDQDSNGYLELHRASAYKPKHRSPLNIALIRLGDVGSFVLDVDMKQVGREYGHRDLCVFFGFNAPERYYYTHLATKGDQNAHQVFIVNDAPRTPITNDRTKGVDWGKDVWRHVRVVRDAKKGEIRVYFDDMDKPVQTAKDTAFRTGYVGFGSFDDVGRIDNIRLWAESMGDEPCKHFEGKE
ncbi:MAG: hypothetical protein ACE37H_08690 [Phycisphaeraceae bacterium]